MPLHPTQRLQSGRYVLLGALNSGGEAEVWRALDTSCGEERALKVWRTAEGGADAAARELAIGRRIAHPHVVRVEDAFVEGDHAFAVMELAEGSLAERVATLGPLSPAEALAALTGPVRALAEAHAAGIVHRDVKPHNLLVFGDLAGTFGVDGAAVVRIGDFGIAQLRAEGMTRTRSGTLLGSLPFMSPEQRRDPKRVGPATDVYAMAVTLAWLVTGEAPGDLYLETTIAELRERLRARGVSDVDNAVLCDAVARGGALAPEARGTLEAWWKGVGTPGEVGTGSQRRGGWERHTILAWCAGLLTVALIFARLTAKIAEPSIRIFDRDTATSRRGASTSPMCSDAPFQYSTIVRAAGREALTGSFVDLNNDGHTDQVFQEQQDETITTYLGTDRSPLLSTPLTTHVGRSATPPAFVRSSEHVDAWFALPDEGALTGYRWVTSWERISTLTQTGEPRSPVATDWDGDGNIDLIFEIRDCIAWRAGNKSTYGPHVCITDNDIGHWLGRAYRAGSSPPSPMVATDTAIAILIANTRGMLARVQTIAPLPEGVAPITVHAGNLDDDDADELYALTQDRRLLRWRKDEDWCQILDHTPLRTGRMQLADVGDADNDGLIDVLATATCAGCTSNHVLIHGENIQKR